MTKPKTIKVRVPGVVAPDGRSEHVEKINPSVMRALRAVERGEVFRLIQNSSSKMQGPTGIGPIQFWRCQWAKLIEDGPRIGVEFRYQQVLTVTGKRAVCTGVFEP